MRQMTKAQMDALKMTAAQRLCVIPDPNDVNSWIILEILAKRVTVKHPGNVMPTWSETETIDAKAEVMTPETEEDIAAIQALADFFETTKTVIITRWAKVLAKILGIMLGG